MQIDFHHAVTYVCSRLAGFPHEDADIISYAAQYVDDATCCGTICFDNKALYQRISSAHKAIDPLNLNALENQKVWMPFHFLPGNGGADPGDNPEGTFIHKLICLPDSPVAQEMVRAAILDHDKPYSLHRLGITMHVYADTWAHQGFAGVLHEINKVDDIEETGSSNVFKDGLLNLVNHLIPEVGHGRAFVFPDMPFLSWKYKNGHGKLIERNNTEIFCLAADGLCRAMQEYRRHANPTVQISGIGAEDMQKIKALFSGQKKEDAHKRHKGWLQAVSGTGGSAFSFGKADISYAEDGNASWKCQALGDSSDQEDCHEYAYKDTFLASNWKLFHDALQLHRITVAHDILPKYGICAA
jgi:nitrate/TMAO reductase-like tetraheme cytochrome c subunit